MRNRKLRFINCLILLVFVAGCQKPQQVKQPNILLICVDDLRPELKSFGADHIISPNIDKLAKKGVAFQSHYVNSPSCGPSRYTLLTGNYGTPNNNALFLRAQQITNGQTVNQSMPEWFKTHGYTTVSVGKVSHHPGGRGGLNWNDSTNIEMPNAWDRHLMPVEKWQHPRGAMHGLAYGEIRVNASEMDVFQSAEGHDDIYPDGAITNVALNELKTLTADNKKPFFLAVGFLKPHLPFGAPKAYLDKYEDIEFPEVNHNQKPIGRTTWHKSGEFNQYNKWDKDPNTDSEFAEEIRRHYAACVSYADAQVGKVLAELKRTGADKNTIVVLWGDHGWHLGEHAIWGKHSLFEESLHAPLIIHDPRVKQNGFKTNAMVETLDIFPTLCDLTAIENPKFTKGVSLKDILNKQDTIGHSVLAYKPGAKTLRTKTHRLILHNDGFVELYDHTTIEKETKNIADKYPELVNKLIDELRAKFHNEF
ncbi:sulfatase [Sabulilitoribacter arenilitoris]|uniref:Sulfatase n=1 Tax=Wocania arenilitoris TaxID=2044858 RepID=A0AAE3EMI7_9FLAO|nr:sulfatase [Wocania arenilitoris]MCF7567182.1 sulfatase [Wocania arenilitoris]